MQVDILSFKLLINILFDIYQLMGIFIRPPILTFNKEKFMVATKTAIDKQQALKQINNLISHFKTCCNQKQQPNPSQFEHIISHDFQNTTNGKLIGKNVPDFLRRLQEVQKKYSHFEYNIINDCLLSGNKAIVQYDMNLTLQNGEKRRFTTMAIATFDGEIIAEWSQVSHLHTHPK